ncbi:universal stress protein [Rhodococcus qingshengii]|uniref:universal stress protein n=1 Tax=Rhodococcus qingshengii TaxID=334542 RepID=UPI001C8B464D|nr:universal stress protein [Rhodococcus qingshengii]MBX9151315.1 universal stress protein [Rhodococcus qingshengii]
MNHQRHDGPHPEYICHLANLSTDRVRTRHVVLGIDPGATSKNVLSHALTLAAKEDSALHVVHCITSEDLPVETDSPEFETRLHDEMVSQREQTTSALASHADTWTYDCTYGDPAGVILATADKYDAFTIVIGSPRKGAASAVSRLMHISVTSRLNRQNRYPVISVPTGVSSAR